MNSMERVLYIICEFEGTRLKAHSNTRDNVYKLNVNRRERFYNLILNYQEQFYKLNVNYRENCFIRVREGTRPNGLLHSWAHVWLRACSQVRRCLPSSSSSRQLARKPPPPPPPTRPPHHHGLRGFLAARASRAATL